MVHQEIITLFRETDEGRASHRQEHWPPCLLSLTNAPSCIQIALKAMKNNRLTRAFSTNWYSWSARVG
ncbi:MAG: hypothetical protein J2P37_36410, partial [Ktedonobacteraceae bacterium]|nr:hypothetical protein [Ktedonobacteraceae bacterium]